MSFQAKGPPGHQCAQHQPACLQNLKMLRTKRKMLIAFKEEKKQVPNTELRIKITLNLSKATLEDRQ